MISLITLFSRIYYSKKIALALSSFSLTLALFLSMVCVYVLVPQLGNNVIKAKVKYYRVLFFFFLHL